MSSVKAFTIWTYFPPSLPTLTEAFLMVLPSFSPISMIVSCISNYGRGKAMMLGQKESASCKFLSSQLIKDPIDLSFVHIFKKENPPKGCNISIST